jgi:putative ABC transport system permease protein
MRTPLARRNLSHRPARTAVAVAGVAFAALLIFLQLGLLGATRDTATLLYDQFDFDVLLISREYLDLNRARTFPYQRLLQAREVEGVVSAYPIYISQHVWRSPQDPDDNALRRTIMVIGVEPGDPVFRYPENFDEGLIELRRLKTVLIDTQSRAEFGPQYRGAEAELGDSRVEIVGQFTIGTGFGANAQLIVSDRTFSRVFNGYPLSQVTLGLVKIQDGADAALVVRALQAVLPEDTQALTRGEMAKREQNYWLWDTSVGIFFILGVLVALFVGVVFVYQLMSSDIANRLPEFATLKAIGYSDSYLARVVIQQALYLALIGYGPGILAALLLYHVCATGAGIPIRMSWPVAVAVLLLTMVMCTISGILALRKVRSADPADVF